MKGLGLEGGRGFTVTVGADWVTHQSGTRMVAVVVVCAVATAERRDSIATEVEEGMMNVCLAQANE